MAADKKSNPAQIAQAVLDVDNQAIKVSIVGSDEPGGVGVDINLFQIAGATTTTNIGPAGNGTQRVVLASDQPTIPVDIQDTSIAVSLNKDEDSVTIYAPGGNTVPIPVSGSISVSNQPSALAVVGAGAAANALRVQLSDESLSALENINVTVTNSSVEITNDAGNPIPVNGTVTANIGTIAGIATAAAQTNGTQRTQITDGTNNATISAAAPAGTEQALVVRNIPSGTQTVSGTVAATQSGTWSVRTQDGSGNLLASAAAAPTGTERGLIVRNIPSGTQTVSGTVSVNALPAGTNNIGDVDIASLPAPLNVTGSGAAASALRVQLADESLTALENINVTVTNSSVEITNDVGNPVPVSGTVTANIGTTNGLALDSTVNSLLKPASTLAAVTTVGSITNTVVVKADTPANQTNALKVDGSAVTQPVSAVDLDIRNLTATDVVTVTGGAGQTADVKVTLDGEQVAVSNFPAPLSVSGAGAAASALRVQLSDESLSALENISVTVTNSAVEITNDSGNPIPISANSLPLPAGAATSDKQDTIIGHLDGVEGLLTTIDADTGAIVTSVQLLDDTVTTDGALLSGTKMIMVGGSDGTNAQFLATNASGHLSINDGGNSITVDGVVTANLGSIAGVATEATLSAINAKTPALGQETMANSVPVVIANNQSTLPISGTVTANIGTVNGLALNTTVDSLLKPSSTLNAVTSVGSIASTVVIKADTAVNQTSALKVDGSAVTQPVSGTVSIGNSPTVSVSNFPATQAVSAVNLDIRDLTQADVVTVTGGANQLADVKVSLDGESVTIANFPASQTVNGTVSVNSLPAGNNNIGDVDIASLPAPLNVVGAGAASSALRVQLSDESLAALESITVDVGTVEITNDSGNPIPISASTLPLPTGAATEAKQDIANTSLQLLDDVVVTVGTAALTKATQISGTDGTNARTIATNTSGHVKIEDGGNSITVDGSVSAAQSGVWNITNISGTVSLPTGAATSALQTTGNTTLTNIQTSVQLLDDTVTTNNTAIGTTKISMIGGFDGTNSRYISTNVSGHINIADGGNSITVDGTVAATQSGPWNIGSITTLPSIPAGNNNIGDVDVVSVPAPLNVIGAGVASNALRVHLADESLAALENITVDVGTVEITNDAGNPIPVNGTVTANIGSAGNLALNTTVDSLLKPSSTLAAVTTLGSITNTVVIKADTPANQTSALKVDGSAVTQPISGSVSVSNFPATQAITASSLPLPTGAATSANQTDGSQRTRITDGTNNAAITASAPTGTEQALVVRNIPSGTQTISGTVTANTGLSQPLTDTQLRASAVPVSAASLPLPSGAATETTLSAINTKTPALGQAAMASSVPVTIANNQSAVPVSGTVTANLGTVAGLALDATLTGGTQKSVVRGGAKGTTTAADVTSTNVDTNTQALDVSVKGTATVSVSNFPTTQAISAASLPLPTGAATETTLSTLNGKFASLGQKAMTGSAPVVIASDQSAIPASQSGTWNITNISGTVSLPTGASTSANQSTIITSLQLLDDVVATDGSAALTKGYQVAGTDGTNAQIISTNTSGHVNIADGGNSITVDGTVAATQSGTWNITNISGTVSLPTGAATSAIQTDGTQRTRITDGTNNVAVTNAAPGASTLGLVVRNIPSGTQSISGSVNVDNFPAPLSISGAGSATGALRVQLSDDSLATFANLNVTLSNNGVVIENDAGNPVPVSQSGTWNIGSIANSLPSGDNNIGNVDIVTLPGTVQADIGAIKTAVEATNAKTTGPVALRFDNSADPVAYKGEATAGTATSAASWRISRITTANDGSVTIEWADGNTNFDNIWNNRASLSYS